MKKSIFLAIVSSLAITAAQAQGGFPDRPVRLIVPGSPGTITDVIAREFAQVLSPVLKQPVIIENLVGADQQIGTQAAVNAKPDGHTILFVSSSTTVLDPVLKASLPYDVSKDLAPVCGIFKTGNVMNMSATLPFKTVGEVVAAAKGQPEKYSFGYSTATTRLAGELFQQEAGVKFLSVPYKGSSGSLTDVASGTTHFMFIDPVSVEPHYRSGRIKPMLIAGNQRLKSLPDVPASTEAGYPGFDIWPSISTWLPVKTPPDIQQAVRTAVATALDTREFGAVRTKHGLEVFSDCGGDLATYTAREVARWGEIARKAGIEKQ